MEKLRLRRAITCPLHPGKHSVGERMQAESHPRAGHSPRLTDGSTARPGGSTKSLGLPGLVFPSGLGRTRGVCPKYPGTDHMAAGGRWARATTENYCPTRAHTKASVRPPKLGWESGWALIQSDSYCPSCQHRPSREEQPGPSPSPRLFSRQRPSGDRPPALRFPPAKPLEF